MRTSLTALLLAGFATAGLGAGASDASAADLSLHAVHHERVSIHVRSRFVRDLDGTPILLRRVRTVPLTSDAGPPVYEAIAVQKPQPRRYLNGEPVR
jgi:hypothetical protein